MTKVIITENALIDLSEIIKFIARDNPVRAKTYIKELLGKTKNKNQNTKDQ